MAVNHLVVLEPNVCRFTKKIHIVGSVTGAKFIDLILNNIDHNPSLTIFLQRD